MADIFTVGVVGSGIMGAGLAEVTARAGYDVVLKSRTAESAAAAVAAVTAALDRQVAKAKLDADECQAILGRITATAETTDLAECDLVIENVIEDLATKQALFAELDTILKPSAVLATNTSTLSVTSLALSTQRPALVCGLHFFNPAAVMPLVEIVQPATTDADTIARTTEFVQRLGKDPIVVADHAGFVVNALLFPYLNNAVRMLERGTADRQSIDAAMRGGCGFPIGPLALLDLVGLDTSVAILDTLHQQFGDLNYEPAATLRQLVAEGKLGRKTGAGFYQY